MDERPDNVLEYGRKPKGFAVSRRTVIFVGVVALLLLLAFGFINGPTSGQIRLDTGDLAAVQDPFARSGDAGVIGCVNQFCHHG